MLFQSFPFLFAFLPAVLAVYHLRSGVRYRQVVLLLASYLFYAWWDWRFCGLLLFSSLLDYGVGRALSGEERPRARRLWLALSVSVNVGVLAFFKAWDFFAESLNLILDAAHLGMPAPILALALPIGISFYTFQSMSYTIDVYRKKVQPTRSVLHFLVFVSLFPQLVAGPIVRYAEISDQIEEPPPALQPRQVALGLHFLALGLTKKLWIADTIGRLVDPWLAQWASLGVVEAWTTMGLWVFQLYFDFSAYSDMAVGLGLLFGFKLPINFDSPYRSESFGEHWTRWHITLSLWLRDYLFIPLGGSRRGPARTLTNLMVVFLLMGLWHGAAWTFVLCFTYLGAVLLVEQVLKSKGVRLPTVALRRATFFTVWVAAGYFFRATSIDMAWGLWGAAFGANGLGGFPGWEIPVLLGLALLHTHLVPNSWRFPWRYSWPWAVGTGVLLVLAVGQFFAEERFIYFAF